MFLMSCGPQWEMKPIFALLFGVLVLASITDLLSGRIPNWLTYPGLLLGLGLNTISSGFTGLLFGITGMLLGVGLLVALYAFGGMGAGDVKLMGVVGAFLGPVGVLGAFVFSAFAGGIYAIAILSFHPRARKTRAAVILSIKNFLHIGRLMYNESEEDGRKTPTLCYGVAIAIGTICAVFIRHV